MKVFKNILVFEDYNYVAGRLELKISGTRFFESNTKEQFSADSILSAQFFVETKYVSPRVPDEIKNDKTFAIPLPFSISTHVKTNGTTTSYKVRYDKVICADNYVTDDGFLKIARYNTVKDGNDIYSTVTLKAFGLKKIRREEIEKITKYELLSSVKGNGIVLVEPNKKYYDVGEKVTISAVSTGGTFLGWDGDFETEENTTITLDIEKDVSFTALFTDEVPSLAKQTTAGVKHLFTPKSFTHYSSSGRANIDNINHNTKKTRPTTVPKEGCLSGFFTLLGAIFTAIGYLFYLGIILVFLFGLFQLLGWWTVSILAVIALFYFFPSVLNFLFRPRFWSSILNLLFVVIAMVGIIGFIATFKNSKKPISTDSRMPITVEDRNEDSSYTYTHQLEWQDYNAHSYRATLSIISDYVTYEQGVKNSFGPLDNEEDYNRLLRLLHKNSDESLTAIYIEAARLKNTFALGKREFAEVLVSMVQHIPYYAIVPESCNPLSYADMDIRQLLQESPCQGYISYGIKSPSEFLKDLKGDCDSRTLFLYRLLNHFNYDVAVLGSAYYKHSILGIVLDDTSTPGVYKMLNKKKYYVWETTTKGVPLGDLAPEMRNMNYWNFNLK